MKGPGNTPIGKIWEDSGLAYVECFPNTKVDREKAIIFFEECKKLSGGVAKPVLIDAKDMLVVDRKARQYFSSEAAVSITKAAAILIGSPISQVIGSFFIGLNRPPFPIKLFSDRDEAIAWLKGFL